MEHAITVITLTAPAPGRSGSLADRNIPFSGTSPSHPLNLDIANIRTMRVSDDDDLLDGIYRGYGGFDPNQVLTEDIVLGSGSSTASLTAGTRVGYDFSGRLLAIEDGTVIAAYEIAFPRIVTEGSTLGSIVGDRYSIMVIPIPHDAGGGTTLDPMPFDPANSHYFGGNFNYNDSHHAISYFQADCFATGTLIDTPTGPRRVEALRAGDAVLTRDASTRHLVWAGHVHVGADLLDLKPGLRPIRIAAGSIGPGLPRRDLTLSPQHRVLVRSRIVQRMFGVDEILVAAKHLVGLPGITVTHPPQGVGYHHLLFRQHQIVRSEGLWTESLYLGTEAMKGLTAAARREVMALFPELAAGNHGPQAARRLVTGREGRKLAERHARNRKSLYPSGADPLPA